MLEVDFGGAFEDLKMMKKTRQEATSDVERMERRDCKEATRAKSDTKSRACSGLFRS